MSTTTTTSTSTKEDLLSQLCSLVSSSEVIHPSDPKYLENSQTWSDYHNQHPSLVLRPTSLESLSKILAFLNTTSLDFKVRSQGYGNGSAKDVLISLTAFDQFNWDPENKIVTLGPGARWSKYYHEMNQIAPQLRDRQRPHTLHRRRRLNPRQRLLLAVPRTRLRLGRSKPPRRTSRHALRRNQVGVRRPGADVVAPWLRDRVCNRYGVQIPSFPVP